MSRVLRLDDIQGILYGYWVRDPIVQRAAEEGTCLKWHLNDLKPATTQMHTHTHTHTHRRIPLQQSLNDALVDFYIRLLIVKGPPLGVVVLKS
jgi:hypothetical protein